MHIKTHLVVSAKICSLRNFQRNVFLVNPTLQTLINNVISLCFNVLLPTFNGKMDVVSSDIRSLKCVDSSFIVQKLTE